MDTANSQNKSKDTRTSILAGIGYGILGLVIAIIVGIVGGRRKYKRLAAKN